MSDPQPAGYHQLAGLLRDQIAAGQHSPGTRLPSETYLAQTYGLSRGTVRRAAAELRKDGLIDFVRGYGYVVRAERRREDVALQPGESATVRMPTPDEKDRLGLGDGVPVLHIQHVDGTGYLLAGDRVRIIPTSPPPGSPDSM